MWFGSNLSITFWDISYRHMRIWIQHLASRTSPTILFHVQRPTTPKRFIRGEVSRWCAIQIDVYLYLYLSWTLNIHPRIFEYCVTTSKMSYLLHWERRKIDCGSRSRPESVPKCNHLSTNGKNFINIYQTNVLYRNVEKLEKLILDPIHIWISSKMLHILPWPNIYPSTKFGTNLSITFWDILCKQRQTDREEWSQR